MKLTKWLAALAAALHLVSQFGVNLGVVAALLAFIVGLAEAMSKGTR